AKRAGVAAALHVRRRSLGPHADQLLIDCALADPVHAVVDRRDDGDGMRARRVQVVLGKAVDAAADPTAASSIRGAVGTLDADGWLALLRESAPTADEGAPDFTHLDLAADTLVLAGRSFARTRVDALHAGDHWQVALSGRDVDGRVTWQQADAANPHGRMVARLARLALPPASDVEVSDASRAASNAERAADWPALDLEATTFVSHGHALGSLNIDARPDGGDWTIHALTVANDDGRIDAHGVWRAAAADPTTTLEGEVSVREAGAFMARFGWPNVVKGAPSKIAGRITWNGSPANFDYASLSGAFTLDAGTGQFTKIEPGVGRLLGVLSLQALPRRIALDFHDVFSAGFAFDKATGKVTMRDGIMQTDDLKLTGPSAVVDIAGEADLARETQKLQVKVEPALASGVSAGAAALFLANPLVGAVVGAGTLLAQKLLHNPFDQLFSYEYLVSGSWDDPIVARAGAGAGARSAAPAR
ncbi:MAG: YhdP family protein, partial [Casimicrobiaceae bacterium]